MNLFDTKYDSAQDRKKMIEVFHSNDGGYYADEKKEEEKEMSTVSKSYEDPVEIVRENEKMTEISEQTYISPRYKGKNPKTPEQLKAERVHQRRCEQVRNSCLIF